MAVFTAIAAAAAIGSTIYGAVEGQDAKNKQQQGAALQQQGYEQQAAAARQAAGISKEQAASSVQYAGQERDLNILAAQQSADAATQSQAINKNIIAQQQNLQGLAHTAMEVDAHRNQLEMIRNQQRARSMAIATNLAQGGSGALRGSSAVHGAFGQIGGQTSVNMSGLNTSLASGEAQYQANQSITGSNLQMNDLQTQYALQQAQNQTTKSNIAYQYAGVQAGYQTRLADVQTQNANASGLVSQGQGYLQQGQMEMQSAGQFMQAGQSLFNFGTNFDKLAPSIGNMVSFNPGGMFFQG